MNVAAVYLVGVLITFTILAIIITIGGMSTYNLCLQWALIWFVIPVLVIIFVAAVIVLLTENDENWKGV